MVPALRYAALQPPPIAQTSTFLCITTRSRTCPSDDEDADEGRDADQRSAGALVRRHQRLVEMAGLASRVVARPLAQDRKEGVEVRIDHLRGGARGGTRVGWIDGQKGKL